MNFNQGSLSFTSLVPPAAPAVVDAYNGTSLDGLRVVLGNNVGGNAAILVNNREIPTDGFFLQLLGLLARDPSFIINFGNITPGAALSNEGAINTKFRVVRVGGAYDFDSFSDNFTHFTCIGGIE